MTREPNSYRYAPEEIGELNQTIDRLRAEIEQLKALLRRHHLRGAYWDNELAVETRAALEDKP